MKAKPGHHALLLREELLEADGTLLCLAVADPVLREQHLSRRCWNAEQLRESPLAVTLARIEIEIVILLHWLRRSARQERKPSETTLGSQAAGLALGFAQGWRQLRPPCTVRHEVRGEVVPCTGTAVSRRYLLD